MHSRFNILCVAIVALFIFTVCASNDSTKSVEAQPVVEKQEEKAYRIVYLESRVRIIGLKRNTNTTNGHGYGDAFENALRELEQNYHIFDISTINNRSGDASFTAEVYVTIKKKTK
jgi:uncharacterized alpha/beta hydrolase family protein